MNGTRTALVIGGGIAGPVTAMALQKAGIEGRVYEAYPNAADRVGGMLTLAPNGLDALAILDAAVAVGQVAIPMTRMVIRDGDGRRIGAFPGLDGLPPSAAMARPDLYRCLHELALDRGIPIEAGKRLGTVTESADAITAHFEDGTTATGDVLIGADGIHSTVRRLIDPRAPGPDHVPLLNFGAVAQLTLKIDPTATYFTFGKRGFLGYWALPDGTTAWFSNVPHAQPLTLAQARRQPPSHWHEVLRAVYSDDVPGSALVESTPPESVMALGSIEILRTLPRWHRGRMVLVGDAVHAPSPSSGQGASLAIESAVQLARCLRDITDPGGAFGRYEDLRRPRVERVAARAARTNNSKALGPGAITMMRLMMPLASRTFLTPERTLGLEQRYRISWDAPAGVS